MKQIIKDGVIVINHAQMFNGIVYHLNQFHHPFWKKVDSITPDSIGQLEARLNRTKPEVAVSRFIWQHMTDTERLTFLLDESRTTSIYIPETHIVELISFDDARRRGRRKSSSSSTSSQEEEENMG